MFKTIIVVGALLSFLSPFNVFAGSKELREEILNAARGEEKLNRPYVLGPAGPNSFDCSGLVNYSYINAGISGFKLIDNSHGPDTKMLWEEMTDNISEGEPIFPGDLVFLDFTADRDGDGVKDPHSHVGIYIGGDQIIHASTVNKPGQKGVRFSSFSSWKSAYNFKRMGSATFSWSPCSA